MGLNEVTKSMLKVGMLVEINPRSDRTRNKIVNGFVAEILTNAETHPHGLLVKLDSGEIGRIKRIVPNSIILESSAEEPRIISIDEIIKQRENHFVEFKSSALWSQSLDKDAIINRKLEQYGTNTSKVIIAKSIAGFLNADGGKLVIGIKEIKDNDEIEVIGIDSELSKIKDKTLDGYRRMLLDFIVMKYFPSFVFNRINDFMRISFHKVNDVNVCLIDVMKSDKRIFLKLNSEDVFMVRIDASSRQITGEDVVEYCIGRFK